MKHILGSFTLANPTSKRAVSDYVETQAQSEKVLHAEKVKSEHILGSDHDCWDVHTNKDRYWVITSPSNSITPLCTFVPSFGGVRHPSRMASGV